MGTLRAELIRRGATTEAEWKLTDAGEIQTGMHECIIFALFGAAATTSKSTNGVAAYGFSNGNIVVFKDGAVSSFTLVSPH